MVERKVSVFPDRLLADILAKNIVFQCSTNIFFLYQYTLKPRLSHFKKVSVQKTCRLTLFVLVISDETSSETPTYARKAPK